MLQTVRSLHEDNKRFVLRLPGAPNSGPNIDTVLCVLRDAGGKSHIVEIVGTPETEDLAMSSVAELVVTRQKVALKDMKMNGLSILGGDVSCDSIGV